MSRYWSDLVGSLQPYVPGEQPRQERLLKLNTNESPYDPSPKVVEAIAGVSANRLRLYPDPESSALKQAFGAYNGLKPEQVFMGNGSDEVLAHVFQALLKHDLPLCFPEISYSFYPVWCDLYGVSYRAIPLRDDFTVDIAGFPKANGGLLLPNPNAPTGIVLPLSEIGGLLENNPDSVVVIDEAYIDFGGESAVRLIDQFDNLLVVQTLSKSRALAGMRVGVAMGSSDLIEGLERVKNSFNSYPLDIVAQRAALSALEDESYFLDTCQRVIATRERLTAAMQLLGFLVLPSSANFVFATHPRRAAKDLLQGLREQGILVRYFDKPGISEYLRISIGTEEQTDHLLSALGALIAG